MSSILGPVSASRRRGGGGPTILGTDVRGSQSVNFGTNFMNASKWTLASAKTLTELHGWFQGGTASSNVILFIYADSSGVPGTRLAYTSPLSPGGSATIIELSQAGFSVPLAAGDYWVGFITQTTCANNCFRENLGGTSYTVTSAASFNPPISPYPSGTASTRIWSAWAVLT